MLCGEQKSHFHPGVCHSSPFFRQSPFRTFRQKCQAQTQVEIFEEMFEMEIVEKKGMSGIRLLSPIGRNEHEKRREGWSEHNNRPYL